MGLTRRLPQALPRLSMLTNLKSVAEKQEVMNRELVQSLGGIPSGFSHILPTDVEGGVDAAIGKETDGWVSSRHRHHLNVTGTPGVVEATSAQGGGPGVSLNGHTHRLDLLEQKGDLVAFDGTNPVRLASPAGDDGLVLTRDITAATGLAWKTGSGGGGGSTGPEESNDDFVLRQSIEAYALRDVVARNYR
jgi:hypothetical protein